MYRGHLDTLSKHFSKPCLGLLIAVAGLSIDYGLNPAGLDDGFGVEGLGLPNRPHSSELTFFAFGFRLPAKDGNHDGFSCYPKPSLRAKLRLHLDFSRLLEAHQGEALKGVSVGAHCKSLNPQP